MSQHSLQNNKTLTIVVIAGTQTKGTKGKKHTQTEWEAAPTCWTNIWISTNHHKAKNDSLGPGNTYKHDPWKTQQLNNHPHH